MRRRRCIGTRLLPLPLALQEARQQRAEGFARGDLDAVLVGSRIFTEPNLGEQGLRNAARLAGVERGQEPKHNAASATGDGILDHPRVHAAGAHAQAETGEIFIKEHLVGHARGQFQDADIGGGQLHGSSKRQPGDIR